MRLTCVHLKGCWAGEDCCCAVAATTAGAGAVALPARGALALPPAVLANPACLNASSICSLDSPLDSRKERLEASVDS